LPPIFFEWSLLLETGLTLRLIANHPVFSIPYSPDPLYYDIPFPLVPEPVFSFILWFSFEVSPSSNFPDGLASCPQCPPHNIKSLKLLARTSEQGAERFDDPFPLPTFSDPKLEFLKPYDSPWMTFPRHPSRPTVHFPPFFCTRHPTRSSLLHIRCTAANFCTPSRIPLSLTTYLLGVLTFSMKCS